ncbi:MAG: glycosyltransferase family A protein [Ilumatobacteraceae bacterium]
MRRATVLIPTHSHGPLLRLAAESALGQTVDDVEVFIVLDGADAITTDVATEVARSDDRVHVFAFTKGQRHGEAYRDLVLQEARGRIVCYLSDDDLWFPDHVEYLDELLTDADFAHSLSVIAEVDGGFSTPHIGNLGSSWYRSWLQGPANFIPLSAAGHTLDAYRSLPVGWSPAPADLWTDLHMWRKFILAPGMRLVSGGRPTVVHLPSPARFDMSVAARLAEMELWCARLSRRDACEQLRTDVTDQLVALAAELQQWLADRSAEVETLQGRAAEVETLQAELSALRSSRAYRAARRLTRIPIVGRIARWLGKALAAREGR